jgi:catechol 2,3-dioxygenase-like lactoylglutathione lyase family enzyme
MDEPVLDGPRAPDSVPHPPEQRVSNLIPFVHVEDVAKSIAFYYHLGFLVEEIYKYRGTPVWAALRSQRAELMVSTDGDPIDSAGQGVLFYLYSTNLGALRDQLLADGVDVGEIVDGTPGPKQQMDITDPDGYRLIVAQEEPAVTHSFAGLPVENFSSANAWYARLFGRAADMFPTDGEAVWHVTSSSSVYVVADPERAGNGLVTVAVADLDAWASRVRADGLELTEQTGGAAPRRLTATDDDGNRITFFHDPES